jgi:flagellar hook-associated protein 1
VHAQLRAEREAVSGVNLDEEAANLLRFQQAYQAAAQMINTADTVFQSLLAAVQR